MISNRQAVLNCDKYLESRVLIVNPLHPN